MSPSKNLAEAIPYKPAKRKGLSGTAVSPSEEQPHAISLSDAVDGQAQGMNKGSGTQLQNSLDVDLVRAALEGDYVVLEELGRGGMAVVYRAKEKALDREVAIKVLPSYMAIDEAFVERFQHEARTAGKLEHPNIVPIYRVGMAGRVIFFVMKMLKGQSLSTVLRQRPKLGVPEIRRIMMETAAALGYAAKHGVVHRDIKPDNILLDDEGRCVVTDFGIAKSSGGPHTAAGTSMGTPRYMSPEHARGHALDGRSDMYSLGVVAYQCLTGITPFDADDPFAILYKHINEPLPKPSLANHEENTLYAIIEKMLAKEPRDRFQTADELIMALGGVAPSTTRTLVTGGRVSSTGTAQRRSGLSATEIIVTPTFVAKVRYITTRITQISRDRPALAAAVGAAGVVGLTLLGFALWPKGGGASAANADSVTAIVSKAPPGPGGSGTGALAVGAGATTGAAAPVAGATTGAKVATVTDSAARATKLAASTKAPSRVPVRVPFSRCPTNQRVGDLSVLADSVGPQQRGGQLTVNYDVCGLQANTPFTAKIVLTKLNQRSPIGRQAPKTFDFPESASSARSREREIVSLAGLEPGDYRLDLIIKDASGRETSKSRGFRIQR